MLPTAYTQKPVTVQEDVVDKGSTYLQSMVRYTCPTRKDMRKLTQTVMP